MSTVEAVGRSPQGQPSVEHPIAGDELRAIKRYLTGAAPTISARHRSPAWPSIISCGSLARLQSSAASGRTCCATLVANTLPTRAPTCAPCRTTSVTEIPSTPLITPVLPGTGLKACGSSCERNDWARPHDASARALLRLVGAVFSGFPLSVLRSRNWHSAPANELVKPGQGYLQVFQKRQGGNFPFQDWR